VGPQTTKTGITSLKRNLNYLADKDNKFSGKIILWGGEETRKMTNYELLSWKDIE
jgi:hypothetical protein